MTDGLKDAHRIAIVNLLRANERVERAVLFGSRAKETFTSGSDVDIALFGEALTITDQAHLAAAMEELTIPQRVDLLLYDRIEDATLCEHVLQDGIELYRRQESAFDNPLNIPEKHRRVLVSLLQEHLPGVEVWAYGSCVNGRSYNGSDLNLVLRGPGLKEIPAGQLGNFEEALRESTIPFLVEARDWARLPKRFHREVEREHLRFLKCGFGISDLQVRWQNLPFSESVVINPSVRLERGKIYPFVDMAAISPGHRAANAAQYREYRGGGTRFQVGDTLMARITPCLENGKIARYFASDETVAAHGSTEFIVIRGLPGITNSEFVYYLVQWEEIRNYAVGQMTGTSGRQRVPVDSFDHLLISVPPLPEQQTITHILGTLDDKIELNHKINQTLEEIAKAIFKSWFVDFDPVRAKAEGRPTGLPPEISDLFPDELVDSEIGEIPKGWDVLSLDEIGIFRNGLALQKYPPSWDSENLPVVKIAQLRKGNTKGDDSFSSNIPDEYIVNDGDFIFSWSGSLLAKYWVGGRGALNQHLFKVEAKSIPLWFVANCVYQHLPEFRSIAESKATTMGHIKREHLKQAKCVIPVQAVLSLASEIFVPLVERGILAQKESRALEGLSDTLLPRLISGELRIPDAEKFLEKAGI